MRHERELNEYQQQQHRHRDHVYQRSKSSSVQRATENGECGGRRLYVNNISFKTTDQQFCTLFEKFGGLKDCNIIRDKDTGSSRGFGY